MPDEKKSSFINALRGFAIFLVLWGHCIQKCAINVDFDCFETTVFKAIYSFHMPLFMLISGYLFWYSCQKRGLKELVIHRTQRILQPLFLCAIPTYYIANALPEVVSALAHNNLTEGIQQSLALIFDGKWYDTTMYFWFLWSVLACSLAVALACKLGKNKIVTALLLVLGALLVALFPFAAYNLYMYPFFVIGFLFSKHEDKIPQIIKKLRYLSLVTFPILFFFFEKKHYIYFTGMYDSDHGFWGSVGIDAYRYVIGLMGSLFVITLLNLVYSLLSKKELHLRLLEKLGKESLKIYILQVTFLAIWLGRIYDKFISLVGYNLFAKNIIVYSCVFTPLLALGYSFGLLLLVKLIRKIKLERILFG